MKSNEIRFTVNAKPGSKLEQAILQVLNDIETNRNRIMKAFVERKEKQRKKIERSL